MFVIHEDHYIKFPAYLNSLSRELNERLLIPSH